MQCEILALGLEARMHPVTAPLAKARIPVAGRAVTDHAVGARFAKTDRKTDSFRSHCRPIGDRRGPWSRAWKRTWARFIPFPAISSTCSESPRLGQPNGGLPS